MIIQFLQLKTPKNEKTRFALEPNGFSRCGGKSLHELLKGFASDKLNSLRSLDLNLFTGLGVHADAGLARRNSEGSKSNELNALGFFDTRFDAINHGIHRALSFSFVGPEGFLDGGYEFDFVHWAKA
jgi:hypothetical protein